MGAQLSNDIQVAIATLSHYINSVSSAHVPSELKDIFRVSLVARSTAYCASIFIHGIFAENHPAHRAKYISAARNMTAIIKELGHVREADHFRLSPALLVSSFFALPDTCHKTYCFISDVLEVSL